MIIGVTGTLGAGKGTFVEYLIQKEFKHYSMSGFIREEILRREMPVNRDSYTVVGDDIRVEHGAGYIAQALCDRALQAGGDAIVESLQTVAEASEVRQRGGLLWAVDADPRLRYERIQLRKSEKDDVSFDDFMQVEKKEMESDDPAKHNIGSIMVLSDHTFHNDGTFDELRTQVDQALAAIHNAS
jgi:dephospho-CoA kinase